MENILIHGMGQNISAWNCTIALLPHSFNAQCPQLSDFFTEGNCTYNEIYSAFCEYCNNFSKPLNLCGLSLGAVLALNFAIDFPQKVQSLILIAPQFDMPKFLLKIQNILFKFMPDSQFTEIGFTKNDFISLTNSMAKLDFTDSLAKADMPVLILCGQKDHANQKAAAKLSSMLSNSQFTLIENASHEVNLDNPEKLAEVISSFYRL